MYGLASRLSRYANLYEMTQKTLVFVKIVLTQTALSVRAAFLLLTYKGKKTALCPIPIDKISGVFPVRVHSLEGFCQGQNISVRKNSYIFSLWIPYQVRNHSSCCLRKWLYLFPFSTPVVFHNCFWYRSHPHHSPIGIKALREIIPPPLTSLPSQKTIGSILVSNRYFTEYTALRPKPHGSPYGQIRR